MEVGGPQLSSLPGSTQVSTLWVSSECREEFALRPSLGQSRKCAHDLPSVCRQFIQDGSQARGGAGAGVRAEQEARSRAGAQPGLQVRAQRVHITSREPAWSTGARRARSW